MPTKDEIRALLPQLLREDSAFREEVFSILTGNFATKDDIAKILEEIRRLREESERRFEAWERRVEESDRRFEARFESFERRMEESDRRVEARFESFERRMEESDRRVEARFESFERRMEESDRRFAAFERRMNARFDRSDRRLDAFGARFGVLAEGTFRNAVGTLLRAHFGADARRWVERDAAGAVFGHPSDIELDVVIKNGAPILVEIKAGAGRADVAALKRKAAFYAERAGEKPGALYLIAGHFDPGAEALAHDLGVVALSDRALDEPEEPEVPEGA